MLYATESRGDTILTLREHRELPYNQCAKLSKGKFTIDTKRLIYAQIVVMGLAVLAIALFLAIYTLLGNQPAFTRLMTALFVPPLVLAVIVGGYFLVRRR